MASIQYEGRAYSVQGQDSVLDTLLKNGVTVPHSCKAGSCGSCMLRAEEGVVPARAQSGLKDSWKAQSYFLACVCHPETDIRVAEAADARVGATITALTPLSHDVMQVRLHCDTPILFRAGQYVTVIRENGLSRSYSIANLPDEGGLELHVRRITSGRMSGWFHTEAKTDDRVSVLGPSGDCFYVPGREDQPLLLVGTGTGLAPLYGILRDALRHGHRGPVHLFHGAVRRSGLYLVDEIRRLAANHPHVEYTAAVLDAEDAHGVEAGAIDHVVLKRFPKLTGWRGFLCGDPALVQTLKKKVFLSGMASRDIYADAFLPSAPS